MSGGKLEERVAGLDAADLETLRLLERLGQEHLIADFGRATLAEKKRQLSQIRELDASYFGGLEAYVTRARELLAAARANVNPYVGCTPHLPEGRKLLFGSAEFIRCEELGLSEIHRAAFVIVAGGLGERLGFSGIKLGMPAETATASSFAETHVKHLLAWEREANRRTGERRSVELVIMTSDDTHERTRALLEQSAFFGLEARHVTLLKQEKVATLADDQASLGKDPDDPWLVETKPHGHGDVHRLLHESGVAKRLLEDGVRWLVMLQDTNILSFYVVPATLGVSIEDGIEMNSVVIPRRAGEAVGSVARLEWPDHALTINVEYNQLGPLLRESGLGDGDVADETGFSPFPGNVNVLAFSLDSYVRTLNTSGGRIPEFVNPKYSDQARTKFSKTTRLECMMQDYPKLLPQGARVRVTEFERSVCFSAVKNSLPEAARKQASGLPAESASSAEADLYAMNRRFLSESGASVEAGAARTYAGVSVVLFPIVQLAPSFRVSFARLRQRIAEVTISARSVLIVDAEDVHFDRLVLDGTLIIRAVPGARIRVRNLEVRNRGWEAVADDEPDENASTRLRGFWIRKHDAREFRFDEPGDYVIDG